MRTIATAAALAAAVLLAACGEVAKEPGKTYAGKEDVEPYTSDMFKGDKAKWMAAIDERNQKQNDYVRMPFDKK